MLTDSVAWSKNINVRKFIELHVRIKTEALARLSHMTYKMADLIERFYQHFNTW